MLKSLIRRWLRHAFTAVQTRRNRRRSLLGLHRLETRETPATGAFAGGTLTVTLDSSDNSTISVSGGNVKIDGADPSPGVTAISSVNRIVVNGAGGSETINFALTLGALSLGNGLSVDSAVEQVVLSNTKIQNVTLNGISIAAGDTSLGMNYQLITTDVPISVGQITGNAKTLILNAGSSGAVTVTGSLANVTTLTLKNASSFDFDNNVTVTTLTTAAQAYSITFDGSLTTGANATFSNSGTVAFGDADGDTITIGGTLTATAPSAITLNAATLRTEGQTKLAALTITTDATIDTTNNGGVVAGGSSTIASVAGSGSVRDLTVVGGTGGSLTVSGAAVTLLDEFTFSGVGATFSGNVSTTTDVDLKVTGAVSFAGDLTTSTLTFTTNFGTNVAFNGDTSVTSAITFSNSGTLTLGNDVDDTTTFKGGITATSSTSARNLAGIIRTHGTAINFTGKNITLTKDVTLDTTNGGTTTDGNGDISFQDADGTGGIDRDLTLIAGNDTTTATNNGVISATGTINNQIDTITVTQSESATFGGEIDANALVLTDTAVSITFSDTVSVTSLTTAVQTYSVIFNANVTVTNAVTFGNTGTLTFGGTSSTFNGGITATAPSSVNVQNTLETSGDVMMLGNVTLTGDATIKSTRGGGTANITIASLVGQTSAKNITLAAGTGGTLSVTGDASDNIGTLTVSSSSNATFDGVVSASTVTLTATTNTITFNGNLTATSLTTGGSYALHLFGSTTNVTNAVTFSNSGMLQLGNGGDTLLFNGGFSRSGMNPTSLGGIVRTTADAITFTNGPITLIADSTLDTTNAGSDTAGANITSGSGAVTGVFDLTLNAGSDGTIGFGGSIDKLTGLTLVNSAGATFSGAVGDSTVLGSVSLSTSTNTVQFTNEFHATSLTVNAGIDNLSFTGADNSVTGSVTFGNSGTLTLNNSEADVFLFDGGVTATAPSQLTLSGMVRTSADSISLGDSDTPIAVSLAGGGASSVIDTTNNGNVADSIGADIALGGAVTGDGSNKEFTLNAGTGGTITANGSIILSGGSSVLTIVQSANATFASTVTVGSLVLTDTEGSITFNGPLTAGSFTNTAGAGIAPNITFNGDATINAAATFGTTGTVTFGNSASDIVQIDGNVTHTNGTTAIFGTLRTLNDAINLAALTVSGASTINTNNAGDTAGGNVTIGAITAGTNPLVLQSHTGNFTVASYTAGATTLTVNRAANFTVTGAVSTGSGSVTLTTITGTAAFEGSSTIGTLTVASTVVNLNIYGDATIGNNPAFPNTGALRLGDDGTDVLLFNAGLTRASGTTVLGGIIRTPAQGISLPAVTLQEDAALDTTNDGDDTAGSTVSFGTVTGATFDFTVNTGTGNALAAPQITNVGTLTLIGNGLTQSGKLTGTNLIVQSYAAAVLNNVDNDFTTVSGDVTGTFNFRDANDVTIGLTTGLTTSGSATVTASGSGSIDFAKALNAGTGSVTLTAGGAISETFSGTDVTAATLTASAATGISLDTDVDTVTSATLSGTGAIDLSNAGAVTVTLATTNAGNLVLNASSGNLTLTSVTAGGSGDVTATTTTSGTIEVIAVTAADNTVTLNSAGAITADATGVDVIAAALTATAAGSIGASGTPLRTTVTDLALTTTAGGSAFVTETDAVNLKSSSIAADLALVTNGAITDAAGTTISVSGNATFTAGSGNIVLGDDDTVDFGSLQFTTTGSVTITEDSSTALLNGSTGSTVILTSAGAITDAAVDTTVNVTATSLYLNATGGIGGSGNAVETAVTTLDLDNATGGGAFVTNTGSATLGQVSGSATSTIAGGGVITATSPLTINTPQSFSGAMDFVAGNSTATGDNLTIAANVTQTSAGVLRFLAGDDILHTGGTVTGLAAVHFLADEESDSSGAITQSGGGLTAVSTYFESHGNVAYTAGTNDVTDATNGLGASVTSGTFAFTDANALSVGTVNSVNGITASGNVTLTSGTTHTIVVNQAVQSGTGTAGTLVINGAVTLNAAANAGSGTTTTLNGGTGSISITVNQTAGSLSYSATDDIIIEAVLTSTVGGITLTADSDNDGAGGVTVRDTDGKLVSAAGVTLEGSDLIDGATADDAITLTSGLTRIEAGGAVSLQPRSMAMSTSDVYVNGAITTSAGAITIDAKDQIFLAANVTTTGGSGDITFSDATVLSTADVTVTSSGGDITMTGAITGATKNLTLDAAGAIALTGGGSGLGTLTLDAGGAVTQVAAVSGTNLLLLGDGTFTLTQANNFTTLAATVGGTGTFNYTDAGDVTIGTVGSTTTTTTNNGSATVTASGSGSITIGHAITIGGTNQLTLQAGGAIVDAFVTNPDVTATNLLLIAATGIASSGNVLETNVSNLDANNSTSGGAFITNAKALTLTDLNSSTPSTIAGGGVITATSPLTINTAQSVTGGAMDFVAGNGSVDGNDDLTINADVTSDGAGLLRFLAGDDILHTAGHVSIGGTGTVHFLANQDGIAGSDAVVGGITRSGTTSLTAPNAYFASGSDVSYGGGTNDVGTLAAVVTGSTNTFTFTNGANALTIGTVSDNGITTASGTVTLTSGALTIDQPILAGSSVVDITAAGATDGVNGKISAGSLRLQGTGTFVLDNATNDVDTFAANVTGPLTYRDTDGLTVGTVTTVGVTATGSVSIQTGGTLALDQNVSATGQTVTFNVSSGGATSASGKGVTAASLQLTGTGTFELDDTNAITTLAASITGSLEFYEQDGFAIGTVGTSGLNVGSGDATIKTTAGGITQSQPITANELLVLGTGTFTLSNTTNNADTIAANVTGDLTYFDASTLTVGTVGSTLGITVADDGMGGNDLTLKILAGTLTIDDDVTSADRVTLDSAGAVTQNAGDDLQADRLQLLGAGTFTLLNAGNNADSISVNTSATVQFRDADALVVAAFNSTTGIVITGANNDLLLQTGGALTINEVITVTDVVTLNAGAAVTQGGGDGITATSLELLGTGPFTLTDTANDVTNLAANVTEAVSYTDAGDVTVGTAGGTSSITTTTDNVTITANAGSGKITVNQPITTGAAGSGSIAITGNVTLNAALTAATGTTITLNGGTGSVSITADQTFGSAVSFTASDDIIVEAVLTTTAGGITLTADSDNNGTGGVTIRDTDGKLVSAAGVTLTGSDLFDGATAGDAITLASGLTRISAGGAVNLQPGSGAAGTTDIYLNGAITTSAGAITIDAKDQIFLTADVSTTGGTGDITFSDATVLSTADITVTSFGGDITMTGAITGATKNLTLDAADAITLTGGGSGLGTLTLDAGGAATQVAAVSGTNLLLLGGGTFTLTQAANDFTTIAAAITGSGSLNYADTNALTVGTVGSTDGVTTNNGTVTLTTGALTIDKTIAAGTATVDIDAAGATEGASGNITAANLRLRGTGTFTLGTAANNVGTIAGDVTGSLTYVDADGLTVGTVTTVGITATGNVSITTSGALAVNQVVSSTGTGLISLTNTAAGGINIGANVTTANGNVSITANAVATGNFVGVAITKTVSAGTAGNVVIDGHGGDSTVGAQYGVFIDTGTGQVTAAGGSFTITGTAGGSAGVGADNAGVRINGGADVSGVSGNITGTGGSGATYTHGIWVVGSGTTVSATTGNLTLDGTAGAGSSGGQNFGVFLSGGAVVSTVSGSLGVTGQGGTAGNYNFGISLSNSGTQISSTSGPISLNGTGGTTGGFSYGVVMFATAAVIGGTNQPVSVTGTATSTGPSSHGIFLSNGSITGTGTALVTLTGDAGSDSSSRGIVLSTGSVSASSGTVTLNAVDGGVNQPGAPVTANKLQILGTGTFSLPVTTNDAGTLAASVTGPLTYVDANALIIGSVTGTGTTTGVTVSGGNVFSLTAGGAVTQTAAVTATGLELLGAGPFTLTISGNNVTNLATDVTGAVSYTDADDVTIGTAGGTSGITTTGDDVTVTAAISITVDEPIDTSPGTGGTLTIGGGVTLNAGITVGTGNVTLNTGGAGDVIINADISVAAPVVFNPGRDILISAQLMTTGGTANDITLTADSDADGVGGLWVFDTDGEVISAGDVTGSGSAMFKVSNGNSVVLDAGGPGTRITAVEAISLSSNGAASIPMTPPDIYVAGNINAGISVSIDAFDATFLQDSVTAGTSFITFGDAVSLTGDATVTSSGAGLVGFMQTIDGGFNLIVVSSTGGTTFTGKVGDTTALTSLSVTGPANVNGGLVETTGTQTFSAAVTLGADTDFTATTVTFNGTVSSTNKSLTTTGSTQADINGGSVDTGTAAQTYNGVVTIATNNLSLTASTVTFNDTVSSATNKNLTTAGTTQADINGGSVNTGTGSQTYNGAVVIGVSDATLTASTVTFNGNVSSSTAKDLTVTGNAVFGDAAGDSLTGIDVLSVSGNSTITAGTMTTLDSQTYTGTTQVNSSTTYSYTTLLFDDNVTGTGSITFSPPSGTATATFDGASSTYAGTTTLNNGTMTVNAGKELADGSAGLGDAITLAGASVTLNGGGTITDRNILANGNEAKVQNLTIQKVVGSGTGVEVNADSVTIGGSDTTFANLITGWAIGVHVTADDTALIVFNSGTGKGVNANVVGIKVQDDGDATLGEARAFLESNTVNGNTSIGLLVTGGAYVDAGQVLPGDAMTREDFTGLGTVLATTGSAGNNVFDGGYTAAFPAIRNENSAGANANKGPQGWPTDVYAQNNTFNGVSAATLGANPLPVDYTAIETVVFHDEDNSSFGFVNYATPTTPDFVPDKTRLFNLDPEAADEAANPNQRSMLRGIRLSFNNYFFGVYDNIDLYQTDIVSTGKVTPVATFPTAVVISTASVVDFVPTTGEFRYLVNWGKGPSVEVSGSLQDGRYDLTFDAANIYYGDPATTQLGGGSFNVTFHRLYGDVNGDGFTSSSITTNPPTWPFNPTWTDKQVFDNVAYGKRRGQAGYLSYLDYDNNGRIDSSDRNQHNIRLNVYTVSLREGGDLPQV